MLAPARTEIRIGCEQRITSPTRIVRSSMSKSSTAEGTARYVKRFSGTAAPGHFREAQTLNVSSLGIGTYLGQPDDKTDNSYAASIIAAVEEGIHRLDTAIQHPFQPNQPRI